MLRLVGIDANVYDVADDFYDSAEDSVNIFPTSQFLGTEWTPVKGDNLLVRYASVTVLREY